MNSAIVILVKYDQKIFIMLQPVMPDSCKRLLDILCVKDDERTFDFIKDKFSLISGKSIKDPAIIFPKIEFKK